MQSAQAQLGRLWNIESKSTQPGSEATGPLQKGPLQCFKEGSLENVHPWVADEVERLGPLAEAELDEDVLDLPLGGEAREEALQRLPVHLAVVALLALRVLDQLEHLRRVVDDLG